MEWSRCNTKTIGTSLFRFQNRSTTNLDRQFKCKALIEDINYLDTLYFSPLLFPTRPYHALLKDDKLQSEELNNPLNDSMKARDLFFDEVSAFKNLDNALNQIFYALLKDKKEFSSFFKFVGFNENGIWL